MQGRNGYDQLSATLFFLSIIFFIIQQFFNSIIILIIIYALLLISLFRAFSKNINKRALENYKFMMLISPIYKKYYKIKQNFKAHQQYRFFKCPECHQKLRVPRKSGKIVIKCPKCKHQFERKA